MTQDSATPTPRNGVRSIDELPEQIEALAHTLQALIRTLTPEQRTAFTSHLRGLTRNGEGAYAAMVARMR